MDNEELSFGREGTERLEAEGLEAVSASKSIWQSYLDKKENQSQEDSKTNATFEHHNFNLKPFPNPPHKEDFIFPRLQRIDREFIAPHPQKRVIFDQTRETLSKKLKPDNDFTISQDDLDFIDNLG